MIWAPPWRCRRTGPSMFLINTFSTNALSPWARRGGDKQHTCNFMQSTPPTKNFHFNGDGRACRRNRHNHHHHHRRHDQHQSYHLYLRKHQHHHHEHQSFLSVNIPSFSAKWNCGRLWNQMSRKSVSLNPDCQKFRNPGNPEYRVSGPSSFHEIRCLDNCKFGDWDNQICEKISRKF